MATSSTPPHLKVGEEGEEEEDAERFTKELWAWILAKEFGVPVVDPDWLDLPAVGRLSLSTLAALEPFAFHNAKKSYAEQVKPHEFAICCYVTEGGLPPDVKDPAHFHLVDALRNGSSQMAAALMVRPLLGTTPPDQDGERRGLVRRPLCSEELSRCASGLPRAP